MDEFKRLTVRIRQKFYPKLVYAADQGTRSIAAQAGYILQLYLKNIEIPNEHLARIYDFSDYK